ALWLEPTGRKESSALVYSFGDARGSAGVNLWFEIGVLPSRVVQLWLRGCLQMRFSTESGGSQPSKHQVGHSDVNHRLTDPRAPLVVLAQPPEADEPPERPLHYPPPVQQNEADGPRRPPHDFQHPAVQQLHTQRRLQAGVTAVRPNPLQPREPRPRLV